MIVVFIDNMRVYAHHGVLEQERVVGAEFRVSLRATVDADVAALDADELEGTVSYAELCEDVKEEMAVPSRLLEHVAARIARKVLSRHGRVRKVWLRVVKDNPPMSADCDGAGVELTAEK